MSATVGSVDSAARVAAAGAASKQAASTADAAVASTAAKQSASKADEAAALRAKALQPREDPLKAYAQSLVGKASAAAEKKAEWAPTVIEVPGKPRGIEAPAAQPAITAPSASDVVASSMQAIEELSGLKGEGREKALKAVAGALVERFGQDGAKALQDLGFGRLLEKGAVVDRAA